jgi:hypothetical protein
MKLMQRPHKALLRVEMELRQIVETDEAPERPSK